MNTASSKMDLLNYILIEIHRLNEEIDDNDEKEIQSKQEQRKTIVLIKRNIKILRYEKYLAKTLLQDIKKIKILKENIINLRNEILLFKPSMFGIIFFDGFDDKNIHVIPNSTEKYISFSKEVALIFSIKFVDTFRFMASSLSELAENLLEDKSRFKETLKLFSNKTLDLVTRKGVFPYEYIDNWSKLNETRLPSKSAFYNSLKDEEINNNDYSHAKKIWKVFNIKTLGEYSDLYLKTDVAILTDVFENFRDLCLSTLSLDPAHYMTAPGFAFDCMLKYTKVKLEKLTDYNMLLYFESSIRGVSVNQLKDMLKQTYQTLKSMLTELPFKDFEWVDDLNIDVTKIPDDSEVGYILKKFILDSNKKILIRSSLVHCAGIMVHDKRCSSVCRSPQSHESSSPLNFHFTMLAFVLATPAFNLLRVFHNGHGRCPPIGSCCVI
ncbi:hypothetical protein AGLY_001788 [Aphis glycines]|uniref:DNA-directed DNA polymerase n=1 Tax=Aphis glycines TaxID=307491 RepID=A0A6G0U657_APHGL|nr:hypothetical protein AGLY_001788 [Aphis glycines]